MSREQRQTGQQSDQREAQRPASERPPRGGEMQFPSALQVTITLLDTAARTERDIAETLRDMAGQDRGEIAARRLKLADDADLGALEAERRSEHLQQLGRQWVEHANVAKLHRLLAQAARALTGLARTQQDIAQVFAALASQDGSALAAERRQLAAAAAANARDARDQARDLHELAATSAAGPSSPPEHEHD